MKKLYREQLNLFKGSYLKYFVGLFILFILTYIAVYFFMLKNETLVNALMSQVSNMFEEKDLLSPDTTSAELAIGLFWNNTVACFMLFVTGFLPIFLPAIGIIAINSAIMGIMFAFMKLNGQAILPVFFTGIVPHGIFEIPAIILAGTLAFYVTMGIYKKINNTDYSFKKCAINAVKTFLLVCIPLLIIAALIEAFITPLLLGV